GAAPGEPCLFPVGGRRSTAVGAANELTFVIAKEAPPTAAIQGRDQMDRRVASLLLYNTRLSLRRRLTDCGNPRERDQMDRHVASLLAMTGGGKSSLPPLPNGLALVRALATTSGDGPPCRCAPAIQHTFVIAKEGCRLRQSRQGS